jgi:hypothetical protein
MSNSFKYVKEFEFPSSSGFTGSAGQQTVKGYCRGGGVKPKGHAVGGPVVSPVAVQPRAIPQQAAPGVVLPIGMKKGGKAKHQAKSKLPVRRKLPPPLPPEVQEEPAGPLASMAAPAAAPPMGRFNSEPMYGNGGMGMKKGGSAKSKGCGCK